MNGFMTKTEAANFLGVSTRQIGYYLADDKLRKMTLHGRVYIPQEDVEKLFSSVTPQMPPSRAEFSALQAQVASLQQTVETLKLGLGFGATKPVRSDGELLLLRSEFVNDLKRANWPSRRMSEIADFLMSLREEELLALHKQKGELAWHPILELVRRMLHDLETRQDFPANGLDVVHRRLQDARSRFYGIAHVCSFEQRSLQKDLLPLITKQQGEIDRFIGRYLEKARQN